MKEIQGKSTLVRVSARFELSGVDCICYALKVLRKAFMINSAANRYYCFAKSGGKSDDQTKRSEWSRELRKQLL